MTSEYSKSIAATVVAIGALAGILVGLATGNAEVGSGVAGVFIAAAPIAVYWAPKNASREGDRE